MKFLVTGAAGFIGYSLVNRLINDGHTIIGLDNINDYYDVRLKFSRLEEAGIGRQAAEWNNEVISQKYPLYKFVRMNLEDKDALIALAEREKFDVIVNLAAQAGVRYSIENPDVYVQSNIVGFLNILEVCRHFSVKHLIYASSSSVYGLNKEMPFDVVNNANHPVSLYAASKKANELMAHTYSHLYDIPTSGLRFFTVYGPWGRPDMAYFLFADAIKNGKPIKVFNHGKMMRDFTYIDDIIDGILLTVDNPPVKNSQWSALNPDPSTSSAPYRIYNIGNNTPVQLMSFIREIEKYMEKKAVMDLMDIQDGDVPATWANIDGLAAYGYKPQTPIEIGLQNFVYWFNRYYTNS
ncbi:NAD-dependent epimerase [Mucilaginibacter sabulilitoris]|uniref:NAD-dependent epimerase n=1 Tax=Mucilaginibacter sabulilitoris TaxID=1173583 RepID=A0ABZ0TR66_9SPHI|nr:NAD-dependent epimerase [Mucilaginibacter sabulilitoris]WPU95612.1 NAD-dependent epimerase [Mucilaginibacter sabulilitoris]